MNVLSIQECEGMDEWDNCIPEWKRLVCELSSKYKDWDNREDTYVLINQELSKYHGRLDCVDCTVKEIIFDSEEHCNWFVLRFSS